MMTKSIGPYFRFVMRKEGPRIDFVFLPGNIAKETFINTRDDIISAFNLTYNGQYLEEVDIEGKLKTVAIDQSKVPGTLKWLLETDKFKFYKIEVVGLNKEGNKAAVTISTSEEIKRHALAVIPFYNKNNNDLTSKQKR